MNMLGCVLAPFGGALTKKYQPRTVFLIASFLPFIGLTTSWLLIDIFQIDNHFVPAIDILAIGLFIGVSMGLLFGPSMTVLNLYIEPNQRGFITGLAASGGPVSYTIFTIGAHYLAHIYTWRGVFLVIGAFSLHTAAASLTFLPIAKTNKTKFSDDKDGKDISSYFEMNLFKQWHFICILFSFAIGYASKLLNFVILKFRKICCCFFFKKDFSVVLLLVGQAKLPQSNVSDFVQSILFAIYGITYAISKVIVGKLTDFGDRNLLCTSFSIYLIARILGCLAIIIFAYFGIQTGNIGFITFTSVFGILNGIVFL